MKPHKPDCQCADCEWQRVHDRWTAEHAAKRAKETETSYDCCKHPNPNCNCACHKARGVGLAEYRRIQPGEPMYDMVKANQDAKRWVCDSYDHNELEGCSNPKCFKYRESKANDPLLA